jgi:hypothetical protein
MSGLTKYTILGGLDLSYVFVPYKSGTTKASITGYKVNGIDLNSIFLNNYALEQNSQFENTILRYNSNKTNFIKGINDLNNSFFYSFPNKRCIVWGSRAYLFINGLNSTTNNVSFTLSNTLNTLNRLQDYNFIYFANAESASSAVEGNFMIDNNLNVWFIGINYNAELGNGVVDNIKYTLPTPVVGLSNIVSLCIRTGFFALDISGNVWFWGSNSAGGLGNGTTDSLFYPVTKITALSNIIFFNMYYNSFCALDKSGNVWFWGYNYGGFGNGLNNGILYPITKISGLSNIIMIAGCYTYNGIALDTSGNVWFWGVNNSGGFGNAISDPQSCYVPTKITGLSNITSIYSTNKQQIYYTCYLAIDVSGKLWLWGYDSGFLGNGISMNKYYIPTDASGVTKKINNITCIKSITGETGTFLALDGSNHLWSWGSNVNGQFGNQTNSGIYVPTDISGLYNVLYVSKLQSNGYNTFFALVKPFINFWGNNIAGQVGSGLAGTNYLTTTIVRGIGTQPSYTGITNMAMGNNACLAIDNNSNVWFWGNNVNGQFGNQTNSGIYVPTIISSLINITNVKISDFGCLGLDISRNVWFWGNNVKGQLGNGSTETVYYNPTIISSLSNITKIAIGYYGCLALDISGNVWFWGSNATGQVGNGNSGKTSTPSNPPTTLSTYYTPTQVLGLVKNIKSIEIGYYSCLALDTSGHVWPWGYNINGQILVITNGTSAITYKYYEPLDLSGFYINANAIQNIAIGYYGCLAIDISSNVWFWGNNYSAQLGNKVSNFNNVYVPTSVLGGTINTISINKYSCFAIDNSNNVYFWGINTNGQLGGNFMTNSSSSTLYNPAAITGFIANTIASSDYGCISYY